MQASLGDASSLVGLVAGDEVAWGPRRARLGETPSAQRRRILVEVLPTREGAEGYARLVAVRELRRLTPAAQSRKEGCASA